MTTDFQYMAERVQVDPTTGEIIPNGGTVTVAIDGGYNIVSSQGDSASYDASKADIYFMSTEELAQFIIAGQTRRRGIVTT